MLNSVFVDSSAWISYVIPTDSNYLKALSVFRSFQLNIKLFTSLFIIDETITKIRRLLDQKESYKFYRQLRKLEQEKILKILPVGKTIVKEAVYLLHKYPTPNTFSLTDVTNVVLIKKHRIPAIFSFDKDFQKLKIPDFLILP